MAERRTKTVADDDGHIEVLPSDLAEFWWLRARADHTETPPPSPALARDHAELEDLLGSLPSIADDAGWYDEVLVAASRRRRRKILVRCAVAGGVLAAVAAVAAILITTPPPPGPRPELEVRLHDGSKNRSASKRGVVGDRLVVTARPKGAGDLRVYRAGGVLLARCPGGPSCTSSGGPDPEQVIEIALHAPVRYDVILVVGAGRELPDGPMDAYLEAAWSGGARIETQGPIEIR